MSIDTPSTDAPSSSPGPWPPADIADLPEQAVGLAAGLLQASRGRESSADRSNSAQMARMMQDPPGKKFTIAMADQVLRIQRPGRAAARLAALVREYGIPRYFDRLKRTLLWCGNLAARWFPGGVMPLIKRKVRSDSAHVIISAEPRPFAEYLSRRRAEGIRVNFNQLGEAVLGDAEANRRLQTYLQRLTEPGIRYVSVKLSSVVSKISLTGYRSTRQQVSEALRRIYRAAMNVPAGESPRFVNLDMEEYRDLYLTLDVFKSVLDEPEFENLNAGIVLQAYLPDSFAAQQELVQWALRRQARTGAGIKVRLVKGANLAMEQVEASLEDWPQAPYLTKRESDANYKRMLEYACRPEHAAVVRVGIASHNLFDIAFALLLRERRGVEADTEFEMLEGMANAQALEMKQRTGDLIVYSPVCRDAEFESAVAYLVRRFDENTQPGSFLGALFDLREGTPAWEQQSTAFLEACRLAGDPQLASTPNRHQDRARDVVETRAVGRSFSNVPNTDFSLPANRDWIQSVADQWQVRTFPTIPLQIGGQIRETEHLREGRDPSRPGHSAYRFARADRRDVEMALETAVASQPAWEARGVAGRAAVLNEIAAVMERQRADAIGTMMVDAGKAVVEADVEISEAIDFAHYYARSLDEPAWFDGSRMQAAGVVAVIPPWNFPYAIPAGGVLAALMAGNAVILKPASETVLTAWLLANQCWEAGVPREILQFMPLKDGETGQALISDSRIAAVVLTGGIETARMFQSWRPELRLYAETSGKNSMIITAAADLDLAVRDLVRGAFGHSGQKCSATSLALVQREVYQSEKFRNQLRDAAGSLRVGGSWDLAAEVTPVIRPPAGELKQGLSHLDSGEHWLLEPKMIDDNPCLWSPGIKMGVRPGSWYHRTECFGPVLGIIPVDNFEQAIRIQNDSPFGLTGGLHSLDPEEIRVWRERVEVGNAYINRTTTGAIVRRQPFGGWKNSCIGTGAKAGGPNYVSALGNWSETGLPESASPLNAGLNELVHRLGPLLPDDDARQGLIQAAGSYQYWWDNCFAVEHDPSRVHGETNHFRYRRRPFHVLRIADPATSTGGRQQTVCRTVVACQVTGTPLEISVDAGAPWLEQVASVAGTRIQVESRATLEQRLSTVHSGTIRVLGEAGPVPTTIGNIPRVREEVLANGRIELLNYLREQSMTEIVHRYGNIV